MFDANNTPIAAGDTVQLISRPDGHLSQEYPLTIGKHYVVHDFMGSNVVTTCDEPNDTVSYWRGRVIKVQ